jgi:hypothetical protein
MAFANSPQRRIARALMRKGKVRTRLHRYADRADGKYFQRGSISFLRSACLQAAADVLMPAACSAAAFKFPVLGS